VTSSSPGTSEGGNDTPAPQPSISHTLSAPAHSVSPSPGNLNGQSVTDAAPTPGKADVETKPASASTDQGKQKASTGQGNAQSAKKATKIKKR
jgi:hypothetical protein